MEDTEREHYRQLIVGLVRLEEAIGLHVNVIERCKDLMEKVEKSLEEALPLLETRIGPRLLKRKGKGIRVSPIYPCPKWIDKSKLLNPQDEIYRFMESLEKLLQGRDTATAAEINGLVIPTKQGHSSKLKMTDAMLRTNWGRVDGPKGRGGNDKYWKRLKPKVIAPSA